MAVQAPLRRLTVVFLIPICMISLRSANADVDTDAALSNSRARGNDDLAQRQILEMVRLHTAKSSFDAALAFNVMQGEIRFEIKRLGDHPWAGVYACFAHPCIELAPHAGSVYQENVQGLMAYCNHGDVRVAENGVIRTEFAYPNFQWGWETMATEWIPVRWGEHRYLVSRTQIGDFLEAAYDEDKLSDDWFWRSNFYLNSKDRDKPAIGVPTVPPEYVAFLGETSICGTLTEIVWSGELADGETENAHRLTRVRIDVGSVDGVEECAEFEILDDTSQGAFTRLTITQVEDTESFGEIRQPILDFWPSPKQPAVGWTVAAGPWRECDEVARRFAVCGHAE